MMKAAIFEQFGTPAEVLQVKEIPKPVPGRGEVLVRMIASPVNPSDIMYGRGIYGLKPSLPATPGFEGVGIVEASGGGLLGRFRKGKRVAVINDRLGNWSQFTVTRARQVVPVPDDIPDDQAAGFFVNPATAIVMTQQILRVRAGETLVQSAAGSALGQMVIRLGKLNGFKTINIVRRRDQVQELQKLGADHVLVDTDGSIATRIRSILPGGAKYAIDAVGGEMGTEIAASLGPYGRMLVYGALDGEPTRIDPRHMITTSARVDGFWLANWSKQQSIPTMLRLFRQVRDLIRGGVMRTDISAEYPLDRVREAVAHATQDAKGGKILLRIS